VAGTNPFENPKADLHPLSPRFTAAGRSKRLLTNNAADKLKAAWSAGDVWPVSCHTVLFATVLFFANGFGKIEQRRVRIVRSPCLAAFVFAVTRP
jgi:hypothetical protein